MIIYPNLESIWNMMDKRDGDFFMNSAITLIDFFDRYSLKIYFIKRIEKAFIPFVAWNLIAVGCKLLTGALDFRSVNLKFLYRDSGACQCVHEGRFR